jgi:hypothetical protein
MNDYMKIVKEKLTEDVADKFLQNKGIMKGEFEDFENNINIFDKDIIIKKDKDMILVKNPTNLHNIRNNSRGVVLDNGDLYVETNPLVVHDTILDELIKIGIIKNKDDWYTKPPREIGFLTIQKHKYNNKWYLGTAYHFGMFKYTKKYYKQQFEFFIDKIKKNIDINFIYEICPV